MRQYNKDKLNSYGVDFFVLCDDRQYFICHIDVYQGEKSTNIGIHSDVIHLPTTQQTVATDIIHSIEVFSSFESNGGIVWKRKPYSSHV